MKRLAQPHNVYNIFFMLERQRLLVDQKMTTDEKLQQLDALSNKSFHLGGYEGVTLPKLPPRYEHIDMPHGWFVPGKNSGRKHVKSQHGTSTMPSFVDLARTVGENWKTIDKETKDYCESVCHIIKDRYAQLLTNDSSNSDGILPTVPAKVVKMMKDKKSKVPTQVHNKGKNVAQIIFQPRIESSSHHHHATSQATIQDAEILHHASQVMIQNAHNNNNNSPTTTMPYLARPHNSYNVFFILERQRLLVSQLTTVEKLHQHGTSISKKSFDLGGYDGVTIPKLPPRYEHIDMPHGWFVPGKNSDRKHVKSHGLTSFSDLSQMMNESWKTIDKETKDYCELVSRIIKDRHTELMKDRNPDFLLTAKVKKMKDKNSSNSAQNIEPSLSESSHHSSSQAMPQDAEILHNASQVLMQDAQINSRNNDNPIEYVYLPVERYLSMRASWAREQAMLENPDYCRMYMMMQMQMQYQQNQGAFLPPNYVVNVPNSNTTASVSSDSLPHIDHSDHSKTL